MPLGHLHVGITSIQNGGYFWLKTNYYVYLCRLEFLSGMNCPLKSPKSLVRRRKSRWRLSRRRCRSSLSRRFSTFQPSRNDQAIFLSLIRVRNEKIACHRFGWMVFQRVQCFDPNTKRTNRKTQTPSYL